MEILNVATAGPRITADQWHILAAAFLVYALDAMDFMLLAMVMPLILGDLKISTTEAGLLFSATLFGASLGGVIFGTLADRLGRKPILIVSVLMYSLFTGACAVAQNFPQFLVSRILVGFGVGGGWGAGTTLVVEAWPKEYRGRVGSVHQSSFQVGQALAALLTMVIVPTYGWRTAFFIGALPVFLIFYVKKFCVESPVWLETKKRTEELKGKAREQYTDEEKKLRHFPLAEMFRVPLLKRTLLTSAMMAFTIFAQAGILVWLPTVLVQDHGITVAGSMKYMLIVIFGIFCGQIGMGYFSDLIGRKKAFMAIFVLGTVMINIYPTVLDADILLWLGFFLGLFVFAPLGGAAAYLGELFPTHVRGTAINWGMAFGRGVSTLAPVFIAALAPSMGLGGAMVTLAGFFAAAFASVCFLPETRGVEF